MIKTNDVGRFVKEATNVSWNNVICPTAKGSWEYVLCPTGRYAGGITNTYHKDETKKWDRKKKVYDIVGNDAAANAGRTTREVLNVTLGRSVKEYFKNWRWTLPATAGGIGGHYFGDFMENVAHLPDYVDLATAAAFATVFGISGKKYLDENLPVKKP